MVSITIDGIDTIVDDMRGLARRLPGATMRALNRAIKSTRTVMVRAIAGDTGLKSKDVRDALALQEARPDQLTASLRATMKRLPLIQFNAKGPEPSRGRGRGVTYKVDGERRNRIPEAFIATMATGHRGVFVRAGTSARKSVGARSLNLPIRELYGPSLGHVFIKFQAQGVQRAQEAFTTNFEHEMGFAETQDSESDGAD